MTTWLNTLSPTDQPVNGDKPYGNYWQAIVDRPSAYHKWDGSAWVLDQAAADADTARAARHTELDAAAESDALLVALRGATIAQITTYVTTNVTDLPSARVVLIRLAVAVAYLLRGGHEK